MDTSIASTAGNIAIAYVISWLMFAVLLFIFVRIELAQQISCYLPFNKTQRVL